MLTELRIINFKNFVFEKIPLSPMTTLVGPNGSGKSTVMDALQLLAVIMRLGFLSAFPDAGNYFLNLRNYNGDDFGYDTIPMGFGISGKIQAFSFDYDLLFTKDNHTDFPSKILYEGIRVLDNEKKIFHYSTSELSSRLDLPTSGGTQSNISISEEEKNLHKPIFFSKKALEDKNMNEYLNHILSFMKQIKKYRFLPEASRNGYDVYDGSKNQPSLKSDGSNLSQLVQYYNEEDPKRFREFNHYFRKYVDKGKYVNFRSLVVGDHSFIAMDEDDKDGVIQTIFHPFLSDGYYVFACFAALAAGRRLLKLAFFEEPENHLHPHKFKVLYNIMKDMTNRFEESYQVIMTTHSPYFLDYFKNNDPRSVVLLKNGKVKTLCDIPHFEEILSMDTLGEAWFSNVLDWGNP